jgi:hypothetical protein
MRVAVRVDQLHVDTHALAGFLHAAFEQRRDAEFRSHDFQIVGRLAYCCVEVREITFRSAMPASRVRISSWMPLAK